MQKEVHVKGRELELTPVYIHMNSYILCVYVNLHKCITYCIYRTYSLCDHLNTLLVTLGVIGTSRTCQQAVSCGTS